MKKANRCGRCGLAEKRGRVFERVSDFRLCVDCAQIAYKAKDAVSAGDTAVADAMFSDFKKGVIESPAKQSVVAWIEEFAHKCEKKQ